MVKLILIGLLTFFSNLFVWDLYAGNNNDEDFKKLDEIAFNFPDKYKSVEALTEALVSHANNEIQKTRIIYSWVAGHIKYDDKSYNSGKFGDLTAAGVLKSRKAVCTGYANLFKEMCDVAGLEAVKVTGYAKAVGYRSGQKFKDTNHDWNSVKINGQWKLFDPTWGAGFGAVKNGKLVAKIDYTDFWFDVQPEAFIFTHLPVDEERQLLDKPVDKSTYEKMPELSEGFFRLGFDGKKCLDIIFRDNTFSFPTYYSTKLPFKIKEVPLAKTLSRNKTYVYSFKSKEDLTIAIQNKDEWVFAKRDGDTYTAQIQPKRGELSICVRSGDKGSFDVVLVYEVR